MYFDLIYSNLCALSKQTELLEACEWDEEKLSYTMESISVYFNNLDIEKNQSWLEIKLRLEEYLNNNFDKDICRIIMDIVEFKRTEFLKLMELPEQ